jgi:hypothetical protein
MFMMKIRMSRGIIIALEAMSGQTPGVYCSIIKLMPERKYNTEPILVFIYG